MSESDGKDMLLESLRTFGADLSRWPDSQQTPARQALLADPAFRRAWEDERTLDLALAGHCEALDREIARSGAAARVAGRLPLLTDPLRGVRWRSVAAAMLAAAMLGGALDRALVDRPVEPVETVMLDPLAALDGAEVR